MPFCRQCGKELLDGDLFCSQCGTAVVFSTNNSQTTSRFYDERKTVFVGELRKCPSCGMALTSDEIKCSACGHMFVSFQGTKLVDEHIQRLDNLDVRISSERKLIHNKDWHNWNGVAQFFFLWLNVYCLFIPIMNYRKKRTNLTPSEKEKADLVQSFEVVNEAEALIRLLNYYRNALQLFLANYASESDLASKETKRFWINLYNSKYQQVYDKLKNYAAINSRIEELDIDLKKRIREYDNSVKKTVISERIKLGVVIVCSIAAIIFFIWLGITANEF